MSREPQKTHKVLRPLIYCNMLCTSNVLLLLLLLCMIRLLHIKIYTYVGNIHCFVNYFPLRGGGGAIISLKKPVVSLVINLTSFVEIESYS